MPDNACSDPSPAIWIRESLSSDLIEEVGLAYGFHSLGTILAVHRAIFYTDGGNDIVSGASILNKFFEEIAVVGSLSQVMVRITNRQIGLQHRLGYSGGRLFSHIFSFTYPCISAAQLPASADARYPKSALT